MKKTLIPLLAVFALFGFVFLAIAAEESVSLSAGFLHPPDSAKPWVYWWWLDSNATKAGITRDLEEMQRQGIGGALVFDAGEGHGTPVGPRFMSAPWRELFKHAVQEADRLNLKLSFNICSGWDCGGTWVTPEQALKRIVWTETKARGPAAFAQTLPKPTSNDGYYQDVAVLAWRISDALESHSLTNLSDRMDSSGRLAWNVPTGSWSILRFGQTLYGGGEGKTKLSSPGAQGYEIDFLSTQAMDKHFAETAAIVAADIKALTGRTLMYVHDDSWESGEPNWTPRMPQEFKRRRGYDLFPYLAALAGKNIDNAGATNRFLRDFRRTVADLMAEHHYGRLQELSHRLGLGVHAEAGGPFFVSIMDALMNQGRNDIPMGEYWIRQTEPDGKIAFVDQYGVCDTVKQAATAAHIYGKKLCQAEAFTNMGRNWEEDPFMLKPIGDRAFCAGLTRNMLCFYVHQPYLDIKPGYEWPEAGTHFDRNITWWNQMSAFTTYLSRCQFLLQQGRFVADVCYFAGEDAPCFVPAKNQMKPALPNGFDCDTVNGEVLLTRLSVQEGRLVLPDGMSYRLLVLPQRETMTPQVLRRIASLVHAGATVAGPKPTRSPSLADYPKCDDEIRALAAQLWGACDGLTVTENRYGKGRVLWGPGLSEILSANGIRPDFEFTAARASSQIDFIHRHLSDAEIYFVANPQDSAEAVQCAFRIRGRQPELWDAVTGEIREAAAFRQTEDGRTRLPLVLPPRGSIFVIFRQPIPHDQHGLAASNYPVLVPFKSLTGPWSVRFDPQWGGPAPVAFTDLVSWTQRPEDGIKYYSGTATYGKSFELSDSLIQTRQRLYLDLGELKNLAEVRLNGQNLGVLWTKPFRVELTTAAKGGVNQLEVDVINLWPNRLIGDQFLPEEKRYTKTNVKKFKKDSHLLESGLLGPVTLQTSQ